jgi:hypothetical protein
VKTKSLEIATAKGPKVLAHDDRLIIWSIAGMIMDRRN